MDAAERARRPAERRADRRAVADFRGLATRFPAGFLTVALGAAIPVPVDVRALPRVEIVESSWTTIAAAAGVIAAVMSALVALATYKLAMDTARLANATKDAVDAENTRYMKGYEPHLSLDVQERPRAGDSTFSDIATSVLVKNVGTGYAQQIVATFESSSRSAFEENVPAAMRSAEEVILTVRDYDDAEMLRNLTFTYQDAFDRIYKSEIEGEVRPGAPYIWRRLYGIESNVSCSGSISHSRTSK